ncbi:MAG: aminomethyl-transferring glycine dehydrogenase subunit GcvPA [Candidatus Altiarchaeota archaeon]
MRYTPNSPKERMQMLECIGAEDVNELYKDVPENILLKNSLRIDKAMSEQELVQHLNELAGSNKVNTSFLGAGYYRHYIPAAVDHMISRSEFYTAYTPYQAEVSQGVLQALFEYQSMMCELTGKEACNATMYDGSTALAESAVMAHNITGRTEIMVSDTLHPDYRTVLKTYCEAGGLELKVVKSDDGSSSNIMPTEKTAALVVQTPNFFGCVEETEYMRKRVHDSGGILIGCVIEATSLGLIKPPACDITVGEGQCFGNPTSFGGPSFGILATSMKYVRNLPGRLVGETVDEDGKRGYVLTLQAREQHIRREKATSNICTAESLCGIAAAAHLALLGPHGLRRMAENCHRNAVYLCEKLSKINGFSLVYERPFYNEFMMKCPEGTYERITKARMTPGFKVEGHYPKHNDCILFCTTELHSKKDLDRLVEAVR